MATPEDEKRIPGDLNLIEAARGLREGLARFQGFSKTTIHGLELLRSTAHAVEARLNELPHKARLFVEAFWLALQIFPSSANPAAKRKLKAMPDSQKRKLLMQSFHLALDESKTPQRIRLGKAWVKGPDGKVARIAPEHLSRRDFLCWLSQQTYKNMAQSVTEASARTPGKRRGRVRDCPICSTPLRKDFTCPKCKLGVPKVESWTMPESSHDPPASAMTVLDALIAAETLYSAASPRQRELLDLLAAGTRYTDLATLMQLTPKAVDVTYSRLQRKSKKKKKN